MMRGILRWNFKSGEPNRQRTEGSCDREPTNNTEAVKSSISSTAFLVVSPGWMQEERSAGATAGSRTTLTGNRFVIPT